MATQKEIDNASKLTALTYMVAGCLGYSIENLFAYLDAAKWTRKDVIQSIKGTVISSTN